MSHTVEDAIQLWRTVQNEIREHGPQHAFENASRREPELLALALTLTVQSAYPLSR